jgi:hypothetical protein
MINKSDIILHKATSYTEDYGGGAIKLLKIEMPLLIYLINKYEHDFDVNELQLRTGGSEVSVSFLLETHVIQIYKKNINNDLKDFFLLATANPNILIHDKIFFFNKYIVNIFEYGDNYVVMEKVVPLIDTYAKIDIRESTGLYFDMHVQILNEIGIGMLIINKMGFLHGDVTYDNIGRSNIDGHYKIYDFNLITKLGGLMENYERLIISSGSPDITYFMDQWKKWKNILNTYYNGELAGEIFVYFTILLIKYNKTILDISKIEMTDLIIHFFKNYQIGGYVKYKLKKLKLFIY